MTTQGARRTSKPKPTAPVAPEVAVERSDDLSLSAWLAKRGLTGERRMEVAGKWFRFRKTATSAKIVEFNEARAKGDLYGVMASLLVDPMEVEELKAAFDAQPQPILAADEMAYLTNIVNFLVAGDVGESSAS